MTSFEKRTRIRLENRCTWTNEDVLNTPYKTSSSKIWDVLIRSGTLSDYVKNRGTGLYRCQRSTNNRRRPQRKGDVGGLEIILPDAKPKPKGVGTLANLW